MKPLAVFFSLLLLASTGWALSDAELADIGQRVWRNECGGTRDGLTSWNQGEDFASLGIGHFIWYPESARRPFEESFPGLIRFLTAEGIELPVWLTEAHGCPWANRKEFLHDFHRPRLEQLRALLAATVHLQARFLARRMENALPKLLAAAPPEDRAKVRARFSRLTAEGAGTFALIDYVNFKGEGTKESERYSGQGWGLLQVLAGMEGGAASETGSFAKSAESVLRRRVRLAPPERHEERWLVGWLSRVRRYAL